MGKKRSRTQLGIDEIRIPTAVRDGFVRAGNETSSRSIQPDVTIPDGLTHEQFLLERNRYIDARQRGQQRFDQLVTGGSAGALVLSITYLHEIAPSPAAATAPLLLVAWMSLIVALGCTLYHHYLSPYAFDDIISEFDRAYESGNEFKPTTRRSTWSQRLTWFAAIGLVVGVVFLASFAFLNLRFE